MFRASGTKFSFSNRRGQPERENKDNIGCNDRVPDVGRRQSSACGSKLPGAATEELRTMDKDYPDPLQKSHPFRAVGEVVSWYRERNLQVIPAKRGEKYPSQNWREYASGQPLDYQQTVDLFGGANEPADAFNYAVLGGATSDGLVVIDWDDRARALENTVDTLAVDTGKGRHYYVRVRSGTPIGNRSFPTTRLDIRGSGGIAIGYVSLHPSGVSYTLGDDKPILEVTEDWFNSYLATALAKYGEVNQRADGRSGRPQGWFFSTFTQECGEGGRDNTAASLAGRLLNGLTPDDVRAILYVWAEEKCVPPLDRRDIDRIVSSLKRRREIDNEIQASNAAGPVESDIPREFGPEDADFAHLGSPPVRAGADTRGSGGD